MEDFTLEEKVRGCLVGAVVGAELGFAWLKHTQFRPDRFVVKEPSDIFTIKLKPVDEDQTDSLYMAENRTYQGKTIPFIDLGVRAYLKKKGRPTPEDFARLLKNNSLLSRPVFWWDGIHTIQEILNEGMNPRLSGFGNAPCGLICASMVAVGIYHFADPELAYLDGVELASVTQPRIGADWAGLCAAAIAAAFDPVSTPETIVDTVLKLAQQNNRELFYQINYPIRETDRLRSLHGEEEFVKWWYACGGRAEPRQETNWFAYNPISFVLPILKYYANNAEKLMALLSRSRNIDPSVTPLIGGAILGALYGGKAFPKEWRRWAEPAATSWFPLIEVVKKRQRKEKEIIRITEHLAQKKENGNSLLFEKIYGCILAGTIGNIMGSPVERLFYWEIDKQFPGGITTILHPEALEFEDDNQMAMLLVETYLKRDGLPVMARHFGKTWKEQMNRDMFFANCMGNAYDLICQGLDPRITGQWNQVTGSTVMCMEPVGIYHLADPDYAVIDAAAISYMYQRGLDVTAAVILAATVAEGFRPEATVESMCEAALHAAPKEKMKTFDKRRFNSPYDYLEACLEVADKYSDVLVARRELYKKCLFYHFIDPLEVIGLSLAMFKVANGDVRQAAIGGTNIGRDADTIAGRAAMLAGTLKGAKAIPEDWVKLFKPEVLEKIKYKAECLADIIAVKKLGRLRHRQEIARNNP